MSKNNWYVLTGGPSTGKTSLLAELEKKGFKTIQEAARTVIDRALVNGITADVLRTDERSFQNEVARLKETLEKELNPKQNVFLDRGMHDSLAYMRHYGFQTDSWFEKLMEDSSYRKVFLLEPVGKFDKDYARTEDEGFVDSIHKYLYETYAEFGMKPIIVKAASLKDRLNFILNHVDTD